MKRFLLFASLCLLAIQAQAQERITYPVGEIHTENGYDIYNPTTTVWVDLHVVQTQTIAGPYARYAQKFLGITVPMVNKNKWEVIGAELNFKICPTFPQKAPQLATDTPDMNCAKGFDKLGIDRLSSELLSTEDMARQAAERIFEIRKYRYDMITGELGEPTLGAGLSAALDELKQMEDALLEMFTGKTATQTTTIRYEVDASRKMAILCRFDQNHGILQSDNMSGAPIVVKFSPIAEETAAEPTPEKLKGATQTFIVAEPMLTSVIVDKDVLTELIIPVFQQGQTITLPIKR